jgi:hypothetical protein
MTCCFFSSFKTFSKRGCQEKNLPDGLNASPCSTASSPPATVRVTSRHGEYFPIQPFSSCEEAFSERPGAVKGAPTGAAEQALDSEDRSETIPDEGKGHVLSQLLGADKQNRMPGGNHDSL